MSNSIQKSIGKNPGESLKSLMTMYGYNFNVKLQEKIWAAPLNAHLQMKYKSPEDLQPGDTVFIPIPPITHYYFEVGTIRSNDPAWPHYGWALLSVNRYGNTNEDDNSKPLGTTSKSRLRWVQTVYQGNQPIFNTPTNCVDSCPATDGDPFYYDTSDYNPYSTTNGETEERISCGSEGIYDDCYRGHASFKFIDTPQRAWPTKALGTTKWRAILSLVAVTNKRVTLIWAGKWGFDLQPEGRITPIELQNVDDIEFAAHLNLLHVGKGLNENYSFSQQGWEFKDKKPNQSSPNPRAH